MIVRTSFASKETISKTSKFPILLRSKGSGKPGKSSADSLKFKERPLSLLRQISGPP